MTETPKCTSWRGHKFEPRYNKSPAPEPNFEGSAVALIEMMERRRTVTYVCDICVRCGHVVEANPPEKSTETTS